VEERRRDEPQTREKAAQDEYTHRSAGFALRRGCRRNCNREQHLHRRGAEHRARHAVRLEPRGKGADGRREYEHEEAEIDRIVLADDPHSQIDPDYQEGHDQRHRRPAAIGEAWPQARRALVDEDRAADHHPGEDERRWPPIPFLADLHHHSRGQQQRRCNPPAHHAPTIPPHLHIAHHGLASFDM
jgi:hypothetical protein